ncbi:MAG: cell wall-binding repeat-containing protein, partial [Thermoleophilia bacterium]|nr:cell wall-binding repeat-containing protein [Thermoleophilia bacterium]
NDWSSGGAISYNGRYVAFDSRATNLVGGADTNGEYDVFVRDRWLGTTEQVSVSSAEVKGNDRSRICAISADGRYVVFYSEATNLVAGDSNAKTDVFVRDRQLGTTKLVSVRGDAVQANGHSYGGDVNDHGGAISDNGRYVAFVSEADNLLGAGNDTNAAMDVFVKDMTTGTVERVSVSSAEAQGSLESKCSSMSSTGRFVTFQSDATNLVTGDTNGKTDVFVRDRMNGTTERISVSSAEAQATDDSFDPMINANGRYVAFWSYADDLVSGDTNGWRDVFYRDRWRGTTVRASLAYDGSEPNSECAGAYISSDGNLVAFDSDAWNLTPFDSGGWWEVYVARTVGSVTYTSIRGVDRFDTAIKISQAMFPGPLSPGSGVVLAPGWESYQEALCGAPLAAAYGGPVLLNSKTILYSNVRNELIRLDPDYVFCIGLTGTTVANAVQSALPGTAVTMINGADVYEMSYMVAKQLGTKVGDMTGATGIVTVGYNFPDAIGVSALACYRLWPILLTDHGGSDFPMHARAVQAMNELGITTYVKAGTYAPDPAGITGVGNFSGSDRYFTNANAALWAHAYAGLTFKHVAFTTGDKFPDALAAGPYLAQDHGTLLLSPLDGPLPVPIAIVLSGHAMWVQHFTFIACIEPVIGQVKGLLP